MEPQIRYCTTSDGVNIAYYAIGSGPPLVMMILPTSNVQYEWGRPEMRATFEAIAGVATLVRYDHRGFGLSDKYEHEYTTEALVRDLEAVVDKLDLQRFFLIASRGSTYPIALAYTGAPSRTGAAYRRLDRRTADRFQQRHPRCTRRGLALHHRDRRSQDQRLER